MQISRRLLLKYFGASSVVLASCGIDRVGLDDAARREALAAALPPGTGTRVVWLVGSGCSGCSVSFLNRFAAAAPATAADVLMDVVLLGYHPVLMAAAGDQAVSTAESMFAEGGGSYILVVEGGVPTAFGGAACIAWRDAGGRNVTFIDAVRRYAANATAIVSVGTCAAYGGVSAAAPNPTAVQSVSAATGLKTINIPGCPPHPDWIVGGLAALLAAAPIALDAAGRPEAIYGTNLHQHCPRNQAGATVFATTYGVDRQCLRQLGCRGPNVTAQCPALLWNTGRNWCVDANAPCIGCTEPSFPQVNLRQPV
jgi:NiFe hydrogenase small subunit HydA